MLTNLQPNAEKQTGRLSPPTDAPKSPSRRSGVIALGERVIRADAKDRRPTALGTAIALDQYPDRDVIVGVRFGDGVDRGVHRERLRGLGYVMRADDLVADLALIPPRLSGELGQSRETEETHDGRH